MFYNKVLAKAFLFVSFVLSVYYKLNINCYRAEQKLYNSADYIKCVLRDKYIIANNIIITADDQMFAIHNSASFRNWINNC